ncbi:helix-turn-helix domain-containing protein [Actinomadura opuntiae]|uniref:helix-turn-helix domain-containing protein n=1 Tax=Actinomadura sp. OS1-43 TaxID=604315 RepID=UPI00255AFF93|nr:helix-turn-helix domain-containing protein [Actinomadura sp. OS1-43]MDL4814971.1 helix-turn-helix domain-containing protein [Actinomadura sp. OS1-43]
MGRPSNVTGQQRAAVLQLSATGASLREIAERTGVGKDTARRIIMEVSHNSGQVSQNPAPPAPHRSTGVRRGDAAPPVRWVGRNIDGEPVALDEAGQVAQVGDVPVVRRVRVGDRFPTVPPWGRVLVPGRLVGESADGRLLCPHCTRWRTLDELRDPMNTCIGVTPKPHAVIPLEGHR